MRTGRGLQNVGSDSNVRGCAIDYHLLGNVVPKHTNMFHRVSLEVKRPKYPPAPDGLVIYAVGDIHGRADLLDQAHELIANDKATFRPNRNLEVYLGDYIDRGPDSASVVSRLIERSSQTSTIFLRGNHEQLMLDFLEGKDCWREWSAVGCIPSCLSYGMNPDHLFRRASADVVRQALRESVPPEHVRFYADTSSYCCVGPYLFVHAGIKPGIRLEDQNPADLLNIRQSFLEFEGDFGHIVVHGHTPVDFPDFRKSRINIDTGAFATSRLTCLRIDCDGARVLTPFKSR
jgi:serine/threonine protein phosphatase 1